MDRVAQVFHDIDRRDADAFASHLTEDAVFRFGNQEPVAGKAAIRDFVGVFLGTLGGIAHRLEEHWDRGDVAFAHGWVTYTRGDGTTLSVPFATLFRYRGGLISDYRIFVDVSGL